MKMNPGGDDKEAAPGWSSAASAGRGFLRAGEEAGGEGEGVAMEAVVRGLGFFFSFFVCGFLDEWECVCASGRVGVEAKAVAGQVNPDVLCGHALDFTTLTATFFKRKLGSPYKTNHDGGHARHKNQLI